MENIQSTRRIGVKEVFRKNWLKFHLVEFYTREGTKSLYEFVERTTRKEDVDGTSIVGIMRFPKTNQPEKLILISNYRPPIDKHVIELPAGLIDDASDPLTEACRELKEETGYTPTKVIDVFKSGDMPQVSSTLYVDPWKSTETEQIVIVEVDGDDEVNRDVKQALEDMEDITVHLFEIRPSLWRDVDAFAKEHGYVVESKVCALCVGLVLGKNLLSGKK